MRGLAQRRLRGAASGRRGQSARRAVWKSSMREVKLKATALRSFSPASTQDARDDH